MKTEFMGELPRAIFEISPETQKRIDSEKAYYARAKPIYSTETMYKPWLDPLVNKKLPSNVSTIKPIIEQDKKTNILPIIGTIAAISALSFLGR